MTNFDFVDDGSMNEAINQIRNLADNFGPACGKAHRRGLDEGMQIMIDTVHVITGNLRDSIHQENVTDEHGEVVASANYAADEEGRGGNHVFFEPGKQHYEDTVPGYIVEDLSPYLQTTRGQSRTARNY